MRILAIDPGKTTGVVVAEIQDHEVTGIVQQFELGWEERFMLIPFIQGMRPEQGAPQQFSEIVLEAFRLYPHEYRRQVGSDFPSVRVIGIVEAAAYLAGGLDSITLLPAGVKSKVAVLEDHGRVLLRSEHVRDAYKLARYYAITRK